MDDKVMINCPNCGKRTFADNKECIYCKYILKEENDFDSDIYNFLHSKYNENKNKPEAIKAGMKKFGLTMKEVKEIVDHISEQIYQKEEAEKNKEEVKKRYKPREELPTNGIDYSKYVNYSSDSYHTGHKKFLLIKFLGVVFCLVIVAFMWAKEIGSVGIKIVASALTVILFIKTISRTEVPLNPHTFIYSFFECFIHYILPRTIVIILLELLLMFLSIQSMQHVTNPEPIIIISSVVAFGLFLRLLIVWGGHIGDRFTVDYGAIEYIRLAYIDTKNSNLEHSIEERYVIYSIKEIKETMDSIIIYGDIRKSYFRTHGMLTDLTREEKINELKVTKSFKNNRNLIKSLQILAKA